jgi:hypothetical protein
VKIPMPVVFARDVDRAVLESATGEKILWRIGDPAWFTNQKGERSQVIIDSEICGHEDLPGQACYVCRFAQEGNARYTLIAKSLSIREGWAA